MMLFGFGDATDPTANYTDPSGVTCREYETVLDANGQSWCDMCQVGADQNGNPVTCQAGQVMANSSTPIVGGYTAPGSTPVVSQVTPVVSSIAPAPTVSSYTQQTVYDASGNPMTVNCDSMGNCYDANGNPVSVQIPATPPTSAAATWAQNTFGPNWMTYALGGLAALVAVLGLVVVVRR